MSRGTGAGVLSVAGLTVAVVADVGEIVSISSGNLSVGEVVSKYGGEGASLKSIGGAR